jgi:hypothetical protein
VKLNYINNDLSIQHELIEANAVYAVVEPNAALAQIKVYTVH